MPVAVEVEASRPGSGQATLAPRSSQEVAEFWVAGAEGWPAAAAGAVPRCEAASEVRGSVPPRSALVPE